MATRPDAVVPLMMVSDEVGSLDVLAGRLQDRPALRTTRLLLLTRRDELTHLGRALDEDWVHEVVSVPWTPGALGHRAGAHVTRWLRETLPDDPRLAHLDADTPPDLPQASLLSKFAGDDDELVAELVAACERVLGPRPRLHLPRGVRVTREGMPVDAVYILEHGTVALTRVTRAGKVTLHHATTGRIIGILSLASQGSAFVTATTTSEVELILLSVEQLDRALRGDPMTGEALAALLIRSLVGRLERSEILQVEKIELHAALDAERARLEKERARLAEALDALEQARLELLAQERFATLGELAAGVAHELNNPVAALEGERARGGGGGDPPGLPPPWGPRACRPGAGPEPACPLHGGRAGPAPSPGEGCEGPGDCTAPGGGRGGGSRRGGSSGALDGGSRPGGGGGRGGARGAQHGPGHRPHPLPGGRPVRLRAPRGRGPGAC